MKRSNDYLNDIARNSNVFCELTDKERADLKECLLSIYKDIKFICEKYDLVFMLSGGSALGAVRHKGFIPWDDDIDLMMPRKDYMKFIEYFKKEFGYKYILSAPQKGDVVESLFLKVIKKNTLMKGVKDSPDFVSGVLVDIFPIDRIPNNLFVRKLHSCFLFILRGICSCVKMYRSKNAYMKNALSLNIRSSIYYNTCKIVGFIFSFLKQSKWYCLFDKCSSLSHGDKFFTIPSGRALYSGETLLSKEFLPVSKGLFEGIEVNLPNDVDAYLTNLYGDYMTIPPVEKRERHFYVEFNVDTTK